MVVGPLYFRDSTPKMKSPLHCQGLIPNQNLYLTNTHAWEAPSHGLSISLTDWSPQLTPQHHTTGFQVAMNSNLKCSNSWVQDSTSYVLDAYILYKNIQHQCSKHGFSIQKRATRPILLEGSWQGILTWTSSWRQKMAEWRIPESRNWPFEPRKNLAVY